MRELTPSEIISIRDLLQMEVIGVMTSQAMDRFIKDPELKNLSESGMQAAKARIAEIQRFIRENNVVSVEGVH
jgi:pantoate kinase